MQKARSGLVLLIMNIQQIVLHSAIIKGPPECVSVVMGRELSLDCITDIATSPSWRIKEPDKFPKYVYLTGELKKHAHLVGITRVNTTYTGQYSLVFESVKAETAGAYQCQNRDGMDHGPVVEVIVLESPLTCTATKVLSRDNSTILLNLTCSLLYRYASPNDTFIWSDNRGQLQNCAINITSNGLWNSVVSQCLVAPTNNKPTDYIFKASFHKPVNSMLPEDTCIQQWKHTEINDVNVNVYLPHFANQSSSYLWLLDYPYNVYFFTIGVTVVVSIISVTVCIACILHNRKNRIDSKNVEQPEKEKINPSFENDRLPSETSDYDSIADCWDKLSGLHEEVYQELYKPLSHTYDKAARLIFNDNSNYQTLGLAT